MHRLVFAALAWLAAGLPASAADLFVDNVAGDDRFDGLSPSFAAGRGGPLRTINQALRRAHRGDRIVIANTGEPYRESISLSTGAHSGYPERPFVILGNGAILDGTAPVPPQAWEHAYDEVFRFRPPRLAHTLLYHQGRPAERLLVDPALARRPELEPLQWMMFDGFIHFRPEEHILPDEHDLRYTHLQTGITLYHVRHVRIEGLIVQGFQLDGVNAHDGTIDCVLRDLLCRGNARSGISIGGASRVRIEDSTLGDNGLVQLRTEGYCVADVVDTELVDNTGPAYQVEGGRLRIDGQQMR